MFLPLLFISLQTSFAKTCYNASECARQELNDQQVECRGFASCSKSNITSRDTFKAYGAYSAYNCNIIYSRTASECDGESSCRDIDQFWVKFKTRCDGSKSCFNTTMRTLSDDSSTKYNIYLNGYQSGAYSTFNLYKYTRIYTYGSLSLYHANINMYESSYIYAYNDFSLVGANLYCADGQTCERISNI